MSVVSNFLTPTVAAAGMTLSPAFGAAMVITLHRVFASSPRVRKTLTGGGQAVSAALMAVTALLVLVEFYQRELLTSVDLLGGRFDFYPCAVMSASIGMGFVIFHLLDNLGQGAGFVLAISLFVHSVAEGSAAGVAYGTPNFTPIALSIILHNITEGIVIALAAYPAEAGALKVLFYATASHVGQSVAVVLLAGAPGEESALSLEATIAVEGISVGTILAACAGELLPGAAAIVGNQWAWITATCTFVGCLAFLFGI